jgi:hypothetical protein
MEKIDASEELKKYGLHLRRRSGVYSVMLKSRLGAKHIIANNDLSRLVKEAKELAAMIGLIA